MVYAFQLVRSLLIQGMECKPNSHGPSFWVSMVGIDEMSERSNSYQDSISWDWEDGKNICEDEFELRLQQTLGSRSFLSASPTNMVGIHKTRPTTVLTIDTSKFRAMVVQEFKCIPSPHFCRLVRIWSAPSAPSPRTRFDHIFAPPSSSRVVGHGILRRRVPRPLVVASSREPKLDLPWRRRKTLGFAETVESFVTGLRPA